MAAYYIDTSALVKRYFAEDGSGWMGELLANEDAVLFVSSLTRVELTSAIVRRAALEDRGELLNLFNADTNELFNIVTLAEDLVESALQLALDHRLRGADALQLAAALEVSKEVARLTFVSADNELNAAARAQGMAVVDPNELG